MASDRWLLLATVHLLATGAMVGLIWTIHVVHYPLFRLVGSRYDEFQREHMRRISWLLVVPWATETATAAWLLLTAPTDTLRLLAGAGLALVAVVLGLTAFGAAPVHGRLVDGFDPDDHRRLLRVDAVRVAAWTLRGVLAAALVWKGATA